jgi:uncharacterized metal-binding protein
MVAWPALTVSAVVAVIWFGAEWPLSATIVAGAFLGSALSIIFTPDLIDVDGDTLPEKHIRTVPVAGWVVATIYDGISKLIPHRGISHVPVVGTAITVFWLMPFVLFSPLAFWVFAWKCVADLFHIIPDPIVTKIKGKANEARKGQF